MEIKTVHRIYDDKGQECCVGDTVLLRTQNMDELMQATIENIMTNMATFIVDDRAIGYIPIKVRTSEVKEITLYQKTHS